MSLLALQCHLPTWLHSSISSIMNSEGHLINQNRAKPPFNSVELWTQGNLDTRNLIISSYKRVFTFNLVYRLLCPKGIYGCLRSSKASLLRIRCDGNFFFYQPRLSMVELRPSSSLSTGCVVFLRGTNSSTSFYTPIKMALPPPTSRHARALAQPLWPFHLVLWFLCPNQDGEVAA